MKNVLITILVIVILTAAGFAGWYFLFKKFPEGASCASDQKCEAGLKCINKICSSGQAGSNCETKSDCQTSFCVNDKCTQGKKDDTCVTYKDCATGLLCQKSTCSTPPDYSKYFSNVVISKIKPGQAPGPNNVPVETTEFKTTDGIEIDFAGVKPTTIGQFYYEFVNPTTGQTVMSSKDRDPEDQKLNGKDRGTGTDLSLTSPGTYDLNIYFKDELVYTMQIKISQ